ncbi:transcriptional regulator [Bordetella genomosp. 8]|uniref:Transcriptional regulator n=1 Tax=Bordetella genomosp. 8 TaxID=1416806 RepID=A0A1W6YFB1_9BORD|nr:helix-turn-helix transcriptional regulator [Bordetella genomosp. 8]ARP79776.1 transcriptional regulator [Bordetella genomosp. 8]
MAPARLPTASTRVALPRPVNRALLRLGEEISTARRLRRLSQKDLAERIGTSLSTVRRMEEGNPGTALGTFLRALHVLGRLDDLVEAMATTNDATGMQLMREQLPQRVRSARIGRSRVARSDAVEDSSPDEPDELEGF